MRTEKIFCDNCSVEIPKGEFGPELLTELIKLDGGRECFSVNASGDNGHVDLCNPCICRLVIQAGEEALKECDPALNARGES